MHAYVRNSGTVPLQFNNKSLIYVPTTTRFNVIDGPDHEEGGHCPHLVYLLSKCFKYARRWMDFGTVVLVLC